MTQLSSLSTMAEVQRSTLGFHARHDLHLARKTWHMAMGLLIVVVYQFGLNRGLGVATLAAFLAWDLTMEIARLRIPSFNEKVLRIWRPIMRNCEVNRMSAIPHYLLSSIIAIAVFPKPVAVLSILFLACGDPMASLIGILYGKHSRRLPGGKSLIGTLAGIATCILIGWFYLKATGLADGPAFFISIVGGLAGGTAELLPFEVDDNFSIPVVSGFVLWLAFILAGV